MGICRLAMDGESGIACVEWGHQLLLSIADGVSSSILHPSRAPHIAQLPERASLLNVDKCCVRR